MTASPEQRIAQALLAAPGFLLARLDQIAAVLYARHGGCETLAQGELLLAVAAAQGATQAEVGLAAGVDKSTAGYVVDKLALRGLVRRDGDQDDRRRVRLLLTEAGEAALPRSQQAFAHLQRQLVAPLADGGDELARLLRPIATDPAAAPGWRPPPALADAPSLLLRRALQVIQARFADATATYVVTPRQLSLLFILTQLPAIGQTGFSRLFGLDPSTCGVILRNLARRKLIAPIAGGSDRRARPYRITAEGAALCAAVRPLVDAADHALFGPSADRAALVPILQRLVLDLSGCLRFPGTILHAA